MLSDKDLTTYFFEMGFGDDAIREITRIRKLSPTKNIMGSRQSITIKYPSDKMKYSVPAHAKTTEYPTILKLEYDQDTFEYHPQPPAFQMHYHALSGQKVAPWHTPDIFVLQKKRAGWIECKLESDLVKLAQTSPERYLFDAELKIWKCPPGQAYAEPFGFFYEIASDSMFSWTYIRNIRFMEDYLRSERPVNEAIRKVLLQYVSENEGVTLIELFLDFPKISSDDIYALIARSEIYIDMEKEPIAEKDRVLLYSNFDIAKAYNARFTVQQSRASGDIVDVKLGERLMWDTTSWKVFNIEGSTYYVVSDNGELTPINIHSLQVLIQRGKIINLGGSDEDDEGEKKIKEIIDHAGKKGVRAANERFRAIKPILEGYIKISESDWSERTLRDWIKRYREAEISMGKGYYGLFDNYHLSGNYLPKLPPDVLEITQKYADSYSSTENHSKKLVYGKLLNELEAQGLPTPSDKTFRVKIDETPEHEQVAAREGHRAAYPLIPQYEYLSYGIPRHGDRAMEFGHTDHAQMGIQLVHSRTGEVLGKPWISLFIDAFTRMVLAFILTFNSPSYRSNMTLLRLVAYRFNKFPQSVIHDQGKDFESAYYEQLLSSYESEPWERRSAKPHDGDIIERIFGVTEQNLIFNLEGNTQIMKNVRKVTKSRNPKLLAKWTLPGLYVGLDNWFTEYNHTKHSAIGMTPNEAFELSQLDDGKRDHRFIVLNDNFDKLTMPEAPRSPLKVHHYGVETDNNRFNSTALQVARGDKVEVRADPFRPGVVYALVNKAWIPAYSKYFTLLKDRSDREIGIAADELRQQNRNVPNYKVTAKRLATFISSLDGQKFLENENEIMEEQKETIRIAMGFAKPMQRSTLNPASTSTEESLSTEINKVEDDPWTKPLPKKSLERF